MSETEMAALIKRQQQQQQQQHLAVQQKTGGTQVAQVQVPTQAGLTPAQILAQAGLQVSINCAMCIQNQTQLGRLWTLADFGGGILLVNFLYVMKLPFNIPGYEVIQGMLATLEFRRFCLTVSCLKT